MPYVARNISGLYKILLKHQVPPNGTLDLEEVFAGFCKPKKSKKAQEAKVAEWAPDQFQEFLEKVENEYARDRGIWQLEFSAASAKKASSRKKETAEVSPETERAARRDQRMQEVQTSRRRIRRAIDGDMTPKELAWLKMNEETKRIIDNCNDALILKHAIKLARNIAGQERVRDLLERRLLEVSDRMGIA